MLSMRKANAHFRQQLRVERAAAAGAGTSGDGRQAVRWAAI